MAARMLRIGTTPGHSSRRQNAGSPHPARPRTPPRVMYRLHRLLEPSRLWYGLAVFLESTPALYAVFTWMERRVKSRLFGCRMCGQCALPSTAYACPQSCPKQLRNGPCGGVSPEGQCEVYPDLRCVWVIAHGRAEREGRVADLRRLLRPIDHRRWGESSWVNYWRGRDDDLWTAGDGLATEELMVLDPCRPAWVTGDAT